MYSSAPKKIQLIIDQIISVEGGYANIAEDRGGETMYGITEAVARGWGYEGEMIDLPLEVAQNIYYTNYVSKPKFDTVCEIGGIELAEELIDSGVNCGTGRAAKWLQRSLNLYDNYNLVIDGDLGPKSFEALKKFKTYRGEEGLDTLRKTCDAFQASHYISLAEKNPTQRRFIYGWMANRVG